METIQIINCLTNEVIERPMTADELDQLEKDRLEGQQKLTEQKEKAAKKAAAEAKLAALGLTADDLKALGL